jgi:adenylate cyclase class 2
LVSRFSRHFFILHEKGKVGKNLRRFRKPVQEKAMLEIEMKFPVSDFAPIQGHLSRWQARPDAAVEEADHYYNAPDRDFARTDEALRLRRIGADNMVTYKGPKQAGPAKTRTELEVALETGAEAAEKFCQLLTHLGYRAVAVVRKKRQSYHFDRGGFALQVCLDEVDRLGRFVEAEIVAPEEKKTQAQDVLLQVAADLGLKDVERRSYLEMYLLADSPKLPKK